MEADYDVVIIDLDPDRLWMWLKTSAAEDDSSTR